MMASMWACSAVPTFAAAYLDDRPKKVCKVGFAGICYGLLQQQVLRSAVISHVVQLCQALQALLRMLVDLHRQCKRA